MQQLKDKTAVVFAASGEIAGAVARSFAQHGAKVYVTGRNLSAVKALAEEIKAAGGHAEAAKVAGRPPRWLLSNNSWPRCKRSVIHNSLLHELQQNT